MKYNVVKLLRQPGLRETIRIRETPQDIEFMGNKLRFLEPVALEASFVYDGAGLDAVGTVCAVLESFCARCLKPVRLPMAVAFQERFVKGEAGQEQEVYRFDGNALDFSELVRDCLLLNLPMSPLCSESCAGLCPQCGCDRNQTQCCCREPERERERGMSHLKTLLDENKEV